MARGRTLKTPERLAEARRLRDGGKLLREIATALGISVSTADAWLKDPDGAKLKERKQRYAGQCVVCGAPTSGGRGVREEPRCTRCALRIYTQRGDPDPAIPGLLPIRDFNGHIIDFARVDLHDWERLKDHRFHFRSAGYASTDIGRRSTYLHHLVIGHISRADRLVCDHINRDKLDNRRVNLRKVTYQENCANRGGIFEAARHRRDAEAA